MQIGTKRIVPKLIHEEPETIKTVKLPTNRQGVVVQKFKGLPPNAEAKDCVPTNKFPYMEFPFEYFNPLQTLFLPESVKDNNVVACGATSAGKTIIAEMAISHCLTETRKRSPLATASYIGPLKALVSEKERDWSSKGHAFYKYNLSILTGDFILTEERKQEVDQADIICMSSEMLGSKVRTAKVGSDSFINTIKVLVVDESHLISAVGRGPALEVALMKFTKINPSCRIIFLSATMPNVDSMAKWLSLLNGKETTIINSTYRPVDLDWHFEEFTSMNSAGSYQKNEQKKMEKGLQILHKFPNDKFIAFVHGKKTGKALLQMIQRTGINAEFHSADLNYAERNRIETSFRSKEKGTIRVVVATSTLAVGINMPARRVLIVGLHRGINLVEPLDVTQMGGRAGRVGLDVKGDAHVLIRSSARTHDKDFCTIKQPIISQIADVSAVAFHLVSEINEKDVTTIEQGVEWYLRSLAHSQKVIVEKDGPHQLMQLVFDKLRLCGAIKRNIDQTWSVTTIGKVASWFYLSPFDVGSWTSNFREILCKKPTEMDIAWALANTYTANQDYEQKLFGLGAKVSKQLGLNTHDMRNGVKKHAAALLHLLTDTYAKGDLSGLTGTYRMDSPRIAQAIEILGNSGKYFTGLPHEHVIPELKYRLLYGQGDKGMELAVLPGVGPKTINQIRSRRINSCKELVAAQALGQGVFSATKWEKLAPDVKLVAQIGHLAYIKKKNYEKQVERKT